MKKEHQQETILVVDDTPATIEVVKAALEEDGYKVLVATNGEKAVTRAALTAPDLILLDIMMPGLNGYETCRRLKANDTTAAIPIIFMSALTDTFDKVKGFAAGAVDYAVKPIETEELFARVRTHLTISRLLKAQEHANAGLDAANQELSEFAYIVSHDLKAPLRGINQLAHWFSEDYGDLLDTNGKEMLELLRDRVKRMGTLIDGILKYSRVGRIIRENEQIDLNKLVTDAIEMIAPPESIQITVKNELPVITGDRIRIQQLFQNLLSNAVKFMDKPQGSITIGCVNEGDVRTFSVADNGRGIAEQHHDRIFQIFQTITPGDMSENTGVGLSIVKKIVEFYGGRIWVESTIGKGSTFFFTLPAPGVNL
ncbi:MAG: response regulator [bacterium]|nr:response regulator [bacterium]